MREYAKLSPTFWTGATGRALRRRGIEGVVVALYLVSSPHSNMLGLYYQPLMYMAYETGLGIEGASKGLRDCIACGFCSHDSDTEMVWVHEMAAWQIADALSSGDKRCRGIQKDYEALPNNPFLAAWYDRYSGPFNLSLKREFEPDSTAPDDGASQAPSKPLRSQEQEQEQEHSVPDGTGALAPKPLSAKDRIWALGPPLLGDTQASRGLLGRLAAQHGDDVVAEVLEAATVDRPIEPRAWIVAACSTRAKAKPRNGQPQQDDLLSDPTPEWAIKAGFPDRFHAENAGCGPGNAAQFSGGKRVMKEVF